MFLNAAQLCHPKELTRTTASSPEPSSTCQKLRCCPGAAAQATPTEGAQHIGCIIGTPRHRVKYTVFTHIGCGLLIVVAIGFMISRDIYNRLLKSRMMSRWLMDFATPRQHLQ